MCGEWWWGLKGWGWALLVERLSSFPKPPLGTSRILWNLLTEKLLESMRERAKLEHCLYYPGISRSSASDKEELIVAVNRTLSDRGKKDGPPLSGTYLGSGTSYSAKGTSARHLQAPKSRQRHVLCDLPAGTTLLACLHKLCHGADHQGHQRWLCSFHRWRALEMKWRLPRCRRIGTRREATACPGPPSLSQHPSRVPPLVG